MLLGIDYGDKRVGLALAEERGPAVSWKIIENTGQQKLIDELSVIVSEEDISAIVVGWPLSLDGTVNERTKITDGFIKAVQAAIDVEVIMEDERLTSATVTTATGQRTAIDDKSAAQILQTYIDRTNATTT